jgi:hypothetical protein
MSDARGEDEVRGEKERRGEKGKIPIRALFKSSIIAG